MVYPEVNWKGNMTPHPRAKGGTVAESGLANVNIVPSAAAIEAAHQLGSYALDSVELVSAVQEQVAA